MTGDGRAPWILLRPSRLNKDSWDGDTTLVGNDPPKAQIDDDIRRLAMIKCAWSSPLLANPVATSLGVLSALDSSSGSLKRKLAKQGASFRSRTKSSPPERLERSIAIGYTECFVDNLIRLLGKLMLMTPLPLFRPGCMLDCDIFRALW